MDDNGTKCEQMISQQEIRAALDQESFEKLLQSAISQAEAAEPNRYILKSFHKRAKEMLPILKAMYIVNLNTKWTLKLWRYF